MLYSDHGVKSAERNFPVPAAHADHWGNPIRTRKEPDFPETEGNITKRVKAACICQTLHFMLKEDVEHGHAVQLVKDEVAQYKRTLERNRTQYKIVEETAQSDGSVMLKVIKQYNASPVGNYLD